MLTPTTDSLQGWLILAMMAVAVVCAMSAGLALADEIIARRRAGQQFDSDMTELRADTFGQRVVVDGHSIHVTTDRILQADDLAMIQNLYRSARSQVAELGTDSEVPT